MNKITFSEGGVTFEFEAEDIESLRKSAAEFASEAPNIVSSAGEVVAAVRAVKAFAGAATEKAAPPVNKGQQPGKSDIPNCECGIPMSDARGKKYTKGPKQGQNYPYSFYRANDCTGNCEARN